jgi:hypothetical protein
MLTETLNPTRDCLENCIMEDGKIAIAFLTLKKGYEVLRKL